MSFAKHTDVSSAPLIALVDDDPNLRPVLAAVIERAGFRVRVFGEAKSALSAMETEGLQPRVLVTDYQMPGMNGLELVSICRQRLPAMKTISISGTPELPELSLPHCRPDRMLAKPFLPAELVAAVRALLEEG